MKLKRKDTGAFSESRSKLTKVKTTTSKQAEIWHSQEIKVSANYQSASSTYGVKLIVDDSEDAIRKGIKRAEGLVEAPLVEKVQQQRELLANLGQ